MIISVLKFHEYIDVCVHGTLFQACGFVVAETNQLYKDVSCAPYIFIVWCHVWALSCTSVHVM